MAWRLHLTNKAVQHLNMLDGRPPVLAAWSRRDRVAYYDVGTGAFLSEQALELPPGEDRRTPEWRAFVEGLSAPNDVYLPRVRLPRLTVYSTADGKLRLIRTADSQLFLDDGETEIPLEMDGVDTIMTLAFDRLLGTCAALDHRGKLIIYQQHIRMGEFDLGLTLDPDMRPLVGIANGGGSIYVSDGKHILLTDSSGRVQRKIDAHYDVSQMACSPDGRYVAASDQDTSVIRVYDGETLSAHYQRFAIDLVAQATQVQLLADLPPPIVSLSTLSIANNGTLAFSMSGIICVTDLSQLDKLPRSQPF